MASGPKLTEAVVGRRVSSAARPRLPGHDTARFLDLSGPHRDPAKHSAKYWHRHRAYTSPRSCGTMPIMKRRDFLEKWDLSRPKMAEVEDLTALEQGRRLPANQDTNRP